MSSDSSLSENQKVSGSSSLSKSVKVSSVKTLSYGPTLESIDETILRDSNTTIDDFIADASFDVGKLNKIIHSLNHLRYSFYCNTLFIYYNKKKKCDL